MKLGVMLPGTDIPEKKTLKRIVGMGLQGVQLWTTEGRLGPDGLKGTARENFVQFIGSHGLEITALCGQVKGSFGDEKGLDERIEAIKKILDLSVDLRTPIVTTHIGTIPTDRAAREYQIMMQSLKEVGRYAEDLGTCLAAETGPESPGLMAGLIKETGTAGIKVNYDPANIVMVAGDDPVKGVYELKDYIIHTHAKDGRKLGGNTAPAYEELPIGQGAVKWKEYIAALKDVGYGGFLTIERETGGTQDQFFKEIEGAAGFLRALF